MGIAGGDVCRFGFGENHKQAGDEAYLEKGGAGGWGMVCFVPYLSLLRTFLAILTPSSRSGYGPPTCEDAVSALSEASSVAGRLLLELCPYLQKREIGHLDLLSSYPSDSA